MGIGNLGMTEMAIVFVIALIVFGPRRLPEIGRSLGSAMREFRRSLNQIQREIEQADPVKPLKDEVNSILSPRPEPSAASDSPISSTTHRQDSPSD
jgi:sec-independent protein translocase protein TatA